MDAEPCVNKPEVWRQRLLELIAERYARSRPNRPYDVLLAKLRPLLQQKRKLEQQIEQVTAQLEDELQREPQFKTIDCGMF